MACQILVPQPGTEPVPPAVEAQSLNHWTAKEVPTIFYNYKQCFNSCNYIFHFGHLKNIYWIHF